MVFDSSNYALFREKSCFVIDLDGVVYKGKQAIAGADVAIRKFRDAGKHIAFLTNNSASSTDAIMRKLHGFGIDCDRQEILTAAQASAMYIAQHQLDRGQGVLVIGTEALKAEVIDQGLQLADADNCGAVLVGLDPKFDYGAIAIALSAIMGGASLIATNRDANFPIENGQLSPGCGAMVGAIESASGRTADVEIGKPNRIMLDILVNRMHIDLNDCLVIGDMLASDILMANNAGLPSIWISETSSPNKFINFPQPSLCMTSLEAICKFV